MNLWYDSCCLIKNKNYLYEKDFNINDVIIYRKFNNSR